MVVTRRSGLGKGLGALIPPGSPAVANSQPTIDLRDGQLREIPLDSIQPNARQPRKKLDQSQLDDLANSIRELGVLQPLLVRKNGDDGYELIAGERRWRAAKLAGLKTAPAVIRDVKDEQSLEHAIVENLHRKDLNPIDEALAYAELIGDFGMKQEQVAKRVGRSRTAIANVLRLLQLPERIQQLIREERIAEGHARVLLGVRNEATQLQLAERAARESLSVRALEDAVKVRTDLESSASRTLSKVGEVPSASRTERWVLESREQLTTHLDTRVAVKRSGKGGKIVIDFADGDDLTRLMDVILHGSGSNDEEDSP